MTTPAPDWATLYVDAIDAVDELTRDLPAEQVELVVPATPQWTVRQVVAHLAGTAADATSARMDGAPGADWTARHVAERDSATMVDLVAELRATQLAVQELAADNTAIVFNAVVHHADLAEAVGAPQQSPSLYLPLVEALRRRWSRLPIRLVGDPAESGDPAEVVVDDYPMYRALFSRLSRADLRDLTGGRLDDDRLDQWGVLGPPTT